VRKLNTILRAIDKISEATGKLASWLMVVATLIVVYEVTVRTIFDRPTLWAFDLSLMLWGTYIVILLAWTHKEGGHIRVDVFYNRFSTKVKALLDVVFCVLLCFSFIFFLLDGAIDFAAISWRLREGTGPPWDAPLYPLKTMLPIGLVLFGLQCLARFIRDIMILVGRGE
jgi:TRAP-type mannitol/chloroaromatic compound transport system permease small subunit